MLFRRKTITELYNLEAVGLKKVKPVSRLFKKYCIHLRKIRTVEKGIKQKVRFLLPSPSAPQFFTESRIVTSFLCIFSEPQNTSTSILLNQDIDKYGPIAYMSCSILSSLLHPSLFTYYIWGEITVHLDQQFSAQGVVQRLFDCHNLQRVESRCYCGQS